MRLEIRGAYPPDWPAIADRVRAEAGGRCVRCRHPHDPGGVIPCDALCIADRHSRRPKRALTVHHLSGDKSNCRWWNLLATCQGCARSGPLPPSHIAERTSRPSPRNLTRRCILAGSAPGDTVLDPFGGSGTTAAIAVGHGRAAIHIDLSPAYLDLAQDRIGPMLCDIETIHK